jgi:hypothetical protein
VHHTLFGGEGFVADLCGFYANFDRITIMGGRVIGDVDICDDHADFHKRLVFIEQTQLNEVIDTRLLEVRQVFCVVHMSLRIQIAVADFGGVEEFEFAHRRDYTHSGYFTQHRPKLRFFRTGIIWNRWAKLWQNQLILK